MGIDTNRDFASVLDGLLASDTDERDGVMPTVQFDYLTVADELHSGRIHVSSATVAAEYRETAGEPEALFDLLLAATAKPVESLPPIEPEAIARELNLAAVDPADFGKLRRSFAFRNHPDRVSAQLRDRAAVRMQVANMLIDDAKRRAMASAL